MQRPVFIGGVGRSGTTLLADMMGFHPDVTPIYETDLVISLMQIVSEPTSPDIRRNRVAGLLDRWTNQLAQMPHAKADHERYAHGPHHLLFTREATLERGSELLAQIHQPVQALRDFVRGCFAEHCARAGKPLWVNKTPGYLQYVGALRLLFPDMLFVHIVRDGRDVAASVMGRPWGGDTVEEVAEQWAFALTEAQSLARDYPDLHVQVRYEDLLREPQATLERVFQRLGWSTPADLAESYRARQGAFDVSRIGGHRTQLTASQIGRFEELVASTLEHYGYTVDLAPA